MISEDKIRSLLEDLKTVYMVGYFKDDLTTEAEKWGQIQILEYVLELDYSSATKEQDPNLNSISCETERSS